MTAILGSLGPLFALILLGLGLRRMDFPGRAFWPTAERLTYYLLFPALLVHRLAEADLGSLEVGTLALAVAGLVAAGSLLAYTAWPLTGLDRIGFTSLYQGTIRFNTYLGMAAAAALFGDPGLAAAALLVALLIPMVNVCCVTVLSVHTGERTDLQGITLALVRNPLIIACALGLALNPFDLPQVLTETLTNLGRAALPLGLLCVGAALKLSAIEGRLRAVLAGTMLRLLVSPLIAFAVGRWLELPPVAFGTLLLFAALPGAPSAYILARQMGGDAPLMAALVAVQTAVASVTLPLVLHLALN